MPRGRRIKFHKGHLEMRITSSSMMLLLLLNSLWSIAFLEAYYSPLYFSALRIFFSSNFSLKKNWNFDLIIFCRMNLILILMRSAEAIVSFISSNA